MPNGWCVRGSRIFPRFCEARQSCPFVQGQLTPICKVDILVYARSRGAEHIELADPTYEHWHDDSLPFTVPTNRVALGIGNRFQFDVAGTIVGLACYIGHASKTAPIVALWEDATVTIPDPNVQPLRAVAMIIPTPVIEAVASWHRRYFHPRLHVAAGEVKRVSAWAAQWSPVRITTPKLDAGAITHGNITLPLSTATVTNGWNNLNLIEPWNSGGTSRDIWMIDVLFFPD
jgi:hypothetical protein